MTRISKNKFYYKNNIIILKIYTELESNNQNNRKKDWHINIANEREIWNNLQINRFISIPEKCIYFNTGLIKTRNNNSLVNPILGKFNNYICNNEYYLRKDSIFEKNNKIEKNGIQIVSKLKELYNQTTIDRRFVLEFLGN